MTPSQQSLLDDFRDLEFSRRYPFRGSMSLPLPDHKLEPARDDGFNLSGRVGGHVYPDMPSIILNHQQRRAGDGSKTIRAADFLGAAIIRVVEQKITAADLWVYLGQQVGKIFASIE